MNMMRNSRILIILTASLMMTACFLYEEKAYNNPYDPEISDGAYPIPNAEIRIDGDTSDWNSIGEFIVDQISEGTNSGQPSLPGGDIDQFKIAQDDENLYFYLSTANGTPLITEGINFSINFADEDDTYNFNPASLIHNTNSSMGWWSGYNYRIDQENWEGVNTIDPSIRFSGLNTANSAIEYGISKNDYWNLLNTNARFRINIDTWYEPYNINFGDGVLDHIGDNEREYIIILKKVDETVPSEDDPIVQFDRPSSPLTIDGTSGDKGIWEETGYWFQDFLNDDGVAQSNCDIDKVYIKQDDENVYVLLTFNDPGTFDSSGFSTSYNLNVNANGGSTYLNLHADHDGNTLWNVNVDGNALNCLVASAEPGYLELQFDKTQGWDTLPYGAYGFNLQVYDDLSNMVDEVSFIGSYKSSSDPVPSP